MLKSRQIKRLRKRIRHYYVLKVYGGNIFKLPTLRNIILNNECIYDYNALDVIRRMHKKSEIPSYLLFYFSGKKTIHWYDAKYVTIPADKPYRKYKQYWR